MKKKKVLSHQLENATLLTLLDEFIVPSARDLNFEIREAAVRAIGCACLRSIKAAKRHLLIILSVRILHPQRGTLTESEG
jgi:hypothetical protein